MKDSDRRPGQRELSFRAGDNLPFVDKMLVKDVIRSLHGYMREIGDASGELVYPLQVSQKERHGVLGHLEKYNYGLRARVGIISETRLEEGMGTIFEIKEKEKRGKKL